MAIAFKLPDVGEGTTEGQIVRWLVDVGDTVELDQPLVEVETDKAVVELPAPRAGVILSRYGEVGEVVPVGSTLVVIGEQDERLDQGHDPRSTAEPVHESAPAPEHTAPRFPGVQAAPFTRRLAKEAGLDIETMVGTGPRGRVTPDDVRQAMAARPAREDVPDREEVELTPLRRRIGERLMTAHASAPAVTVVEQYDWTELVAMRNALKEEAAAVGAKLTYLAFLAKVVATVVAEFPGFNARWEGERLFRYRPVHLGIAVNTEEGLAAPVLRHADQKSLVEISGEIQRLADGARRRALSREELGGSTLTLTAGGNLGGLFATPILNFPEVAIVGMYRIHDAPVIRDGAVVVRKVGYLSLTFDHRVADGMEASAFLNAIGHALERPERLMLRLR